MATINFPSSPIQGQVYEFGDYRYTFDGVKWVSIAKYGASAVKIQSATPPPSPEAGLQWFDDVSGRNYFWHINETGGDGQWVEEAPQGIVEIDKEVDLAIGGLTDTVRVGDISDYVGVVLEAGDAKNTYQYPDNSNIWYGVKAGASFPQIVPADPASDADWYRVGDGSELSVVAEGSSVPRTLGERFSDVVNVKDFGAVGDGVTDDTAAINTALSVSNNVYIPEGIYRITSSVIPVLDNTLLRGSGTLTLEATSGSIINIKNDIVGVEIRDIKLEVLLPTGETEASVNGIFSDTGTSVLGGVFHNLEIVGTSFGINIGSSSAGNDVISPVAASVRPAWEMSAPTAGNLTITNCIIKDSLAETRVGSGGAHAIYVRGAFYLNISSNEITNMQGGILGAAYGVISNNRILNAYHDNGIYASSARNLSIIGNYIENTHADGIGFNGASQCTATGNTIINAGNGCFRIQDSFLITMTGNNLRSDEVSTNHFLRGYVTTGDKMPSNILFSSNICQGSTYGNPIYIAGGSSEPSRKITICNNIFNSVDTSGLTSPSVGPYAFFYIGQPTSGVNEDIIVRDNTMNDVTYVDGSFTLIKNSTYMSGNVFTFKDSSPNPHGNIHGRQSHVINFNLGSNGSIAGQVVREGNIDRVEKGTEIGEYTIFFTELLNIVDMSFISGGTNHVYNVTTPLNNYASNSSFHLKSQLTIFIRDIANSPVYPSYECTVSVRIGSRSHASIKGSTYVGI